jgi:hypothetical protein
MRFKPFAIYNGEVYTQRQIVQFLRSRGANYNEVIATIKKVVHWGFNVTGIPDDIQQNIDYLGFKLVDYNFPLSNVELNWRLEPHTIIPDEEINVPVLSFPKINVFISFQDLIEGGFTLDVVNKTYLLIGNVKNKETLLVDPVTYSPTIMDVTGGTFAVPLNFTYLWEQDKAGELELLANVSASNHVLDEQVRPAENVSIPVEVTASNVTSTVTCNITGTDNNDQTIYENMTITANTTYTTSLYYQSIEMINCTGSWFIQINQSQWGVVVRYNNFTFEFRNVYVRWAYSPLYARTVFNSTDETFIHWNDPEDARYEDGNLLYRNTTITFGEILDRRTKSTRKGVTISGFINDLEAIFRMQTGEPPEGTTEATLNFYGCEFVQFPDTGLNLYLVYYAPEGEMWNCQISGQWNKLFYFGNYDVYRVTVNNIQGYTFDRTTHKNIDDVVVYGGSNVIYSYGAVDPPVVYNYTNMRLYGVSRVAYMNKNNATLRFVDCISVDHAGNDYWDFQWGTTDYGATARRIYTFNLNVTEHDGTPLQNVDVRIYYTHPDAGDTYIDVGLTGADGSVSEQLLTYGYYNKTQGDTPYLYTNYRLQLILADYFVYNKTFTPLEPMDWELAMTPIYVNVTTIVDVAGTDFTTLIIFMTSCVFIGLGLVGLFIPLIGFLGAMFSLFVLVPIPLSDTAYLLALQITAIIVPACCTMIGFFRKRDELGQEQKSRRFYNRS